VNDEEKLLDVRGLTVRFPTSDGVVQAVSDVTFSLSRGETLGVVGESGSGKSVSNLAIRGRWNRQRTTISGQVEFGGRDLLTLPSHELQKIRGKDIAMVFQDPFACLHPMYRVGAQIAEAVTAHSSEGKTKAWARAVELLDHVGIPNAKSRARDYPHQFSGGMRQRAMIAMALVNDPQLLIADEPTTALDVTVQAQILDLLQDLQREFNSAVIIITHDLGVVAELADTTMVMYAGRAVEYGATREILTHPEMPYTWGLLGSIPEVAGDADVRLIPIPGNPPSLLNPPTGCSFHPRCPHVDKVPGDLCRTTLPDLLPCDRGENHVKRCHLANPGEIYTEEVLPEIAPDLIDPETGEMIAELAAVDPDEI
jgi:peptide/nickel transport system ATP-binding protein